VIPIPVQDSAQVRSYPIVNITIVAACVSAYAIVIWLQWMADTPSAINDILDRYGLVPARFLARVARHEFLSPELYRPLLTAPLVHAGLFHLASNMFFLWVLGDNVEERFGHLGYAGFYATGSVAAAVAHISMNPHSVVPAVGASGGIAAVMGAYLILYPKAWITFRIPILPWVPFRLPAALILVGWFVVQLRSGLSDPTGAAGVAWWAHLGGFAFGCGVVTWFGRKKPRKKKRRSALAFLRLGSSRG